MPESGKPLRRTPEATQKREREQAPRSAPRCGREVLTNGATSCEFRNFVRSLES